MFISLVGVLECCGGIIFISARGIYLHHTTNACNSITAVTMIHNWGQIMISMRDIRLDFGGHFHAPANVYEIDT